MSREWRYLGETLKEQRFGIVGAVIAVVLSDFEINFGEFKVFSGYTGLAVFGLIFLALIQYIDKQFIRRDLI